MGFFDAPKREPIPPHTNRVGTRAQTFSAAPIGRPTAGLGQAGLSGSTVRTKRSNYL